MAGYQAFQRGFRRALKGQELPEEFTWRDALPNVLFFGGLASLLITLLEPESSEQLNFLGSLIHWFLHFALSAVLWLSAFMWLVRRKLSPRLLPFAGVLITPLIFAAISLMVDIGSGTEENPQDNLALLPWWYFTELTGVGWNALILGTVLTLVIYAVDAADDPAPIPAVPTREPPALHRLFSAIPPHRDIRLIRAEAQDHYVAFVTDQGTHLVLMPFSEAIEKLAVYNGLQCHRSHWIIRDQVHNLRKAGSAWECEMENGDIVPVSRRRAPEVRKALKQA